MASGRIRNREKRPASKRLETIIDHQRQSVFQCAEAMLVSYALFRAILRAVFAAPLAIIFAKAITDDKILGIFSVLSDQPDPAERIGRCLLVLLMVSGAFLGFSHLAAKNKAATSQPPAKRTRKGETLWLVILFLSLNATGLTQPFANYLGFFLICGYIWTLIINKDNLDPEVYPLGLALFQIIFATISVVTLLPFHLMSGSFSGSIAVPLLLGVILPLAIAPAIFIALFSADRMMERLNDSGLGRWGWSGFAVKSMAYAALSLVMLGLGMVLALWLFSAIGPSGYQPNVNSFLSGLLSDWSMGALFWILAAVTLWPHLVLPTMALAYTLVEYSPSQKSARTLLNMKSMSEKAIIRTLIWARITGWSGALLMLGAPIVLLFMQLVIA